MINEKVYNMPYKIWYEEKDEKGNWGTLTVHPKEYKTEGRAYNAAYRLYGDHKKYRYRVAKRNPSYVYFSDVKCEICGATYQVEETPNGYSFYISSVKVRGSSEDTYIRMNYNACPECSDKIVGFIDKMKGERKNAHEK